MFNFIFFYNLNGSKSELKKTKFTAKGNREIQIIIKGKKIKKNKKVKIKESLEEIFEGKEICQKPFGIDQEIVDNIKEWCWLSLEKLIALREIGRSLSDYESFKRKVIDDLGVYKKLYSQESSVMELFKELNDYIRPPAKVGG